MMYNYRLLDVKGNTLGVISLVKEDIPVLIMKGITFQLGGSWDATMGEFKSFTIVPDKAVPNRRRNG